jgi:hypothetical protein
MVSDWGKSGKLVFDWGNKCLKFVRFTLYLDKIEKSRIFLRLG